MRKRNAKQIYKIHKWYEAALCLIHRFIQNSALQEKKQRSLYPHCYRDIPPTADNTAVITSMYTSRQVDLTSETAQLHKSSICPSFVKLDHSGGFFKGAVDQILIYDVFVEKRQGEFISYLSWCDLCHRWGYRPFLLKLGIWFRNANCQHSGNSLWY